MMTRIVLTLSFFFCATSICRAEFPDRPTAKALDGGIEFFQADLSGGKPGQTMKLWVYLPPGKHAAKSLPCVFVAPAGSNLLTGIGLGDGDRVEHLPYVREGFAVIAYELDGVAAGRTYAGVLPAAKQFIAAHGGVDNAHTAVDYTLARVPEVDPKRLYAAGHSSAATVALDVAAADSRVSACCAYAPCPDLRSRIKPETVTILSRRVEGFDQFMDDASPARHLDELKSKAVMLFTAQDDNNVPTDTVQRFAKQLQDAGAKNVKLVIVEHGGHFESMIKDGLRAGIAFLKSVDTKAVS